MRVVRLEGARGLGRFVDAPWRILDVGAFPQWVPPLRMSTRSILNERKNPFFRNAARALFLAEEGGEPVGRIAATWNGWASDAGSEAGTLGFFTCVPRQEVADALFAEAEGWLAARGSTRVTGPLDPTTNYEGGVLVKGHDHPQTFLTPWNPPYHQGLFEAAGYTKGADLLGWHVPLTVFQGDYMRRLTGVARRAAERRGVTFERVPSGGFDTYMHRCWEIYCACWSDQWGFVAPTLDEWLFIAHELKPLMLPELSLVARVGGEIVGFSLILPDYNRAMASDRSGRLLPLNWLRLLRARGRSAWVRVMLAGVLPPFRRLGLLPVLLDASLSRADDLGIRHAEASWVLEDNDELNGFLRGAGAEPYRMWRLYVKELG